MAAEVVLDILTSAAILCGSLAPGETLNASESTDFFERFQDMTDSWSTDRENLFVVGVQTLVASVAKSAYTIWADPSADFNQTRPMLIQTASHVLNGITEALELVDSTNFASIQDKSTTAKLILKMYCDYGEPIATLNVWPTPVNPPTFELYTQTPLPTWDTLFDPVNLPNGYKRAFKYNLAMNIAPDLGTPSDILAIIAPEAEKSYMEMRRLNQQFLASQLGSNSLGTIPMVGVPKTTGVNLANPQLGGPSQMVPSQQ